MLQTDMYIVHYSLSLSLSRQRERERERERRESNTIFWKLVLPPSVGKIQTLLSQPLKCYVISATLLHSFIAGTQESYIKRLSLQRIKN